MPRTKFQDDKKAVRQGKTDTVPISISRVQAYDRCPAHYKFRYIDRLPNTFGDAGRAGTAFHDYVTELMSGNDKAELDFPLASFADYQRMKKLAQEIAEDKTDVAALEETLQWTVSLDGKVVEYEARLDKLQLLDDDTAVVTDYKTGHYVPTSLDYDPQGLMYALAVVKHYPKTWRVIFRQAQIRKGRTLEVVFDLTTILAWEEALNAKVKKMMKDTELEATPGDFCRLCPYSVGHCQVGAILIGKSWAVRDTESARKVGGALAQLDGVTNTLRNALKKWVEVEGEVRLESGDVWKHNEKKSVRIPKERLAEARAILDEYGHNPDDYIESKLNYVTGRKYLEGKYAIAELREIAEEVPYTRFELVKGKE